MEESNLQFILGKPLRGCLRRQGGMMRGWQRKFCVLQDRCFFIFNREDDTKPAGSYFLDDYHLKEIPKNNDEPEKFVFEIIPEKGAGETVTLCASSDSERKVWMKALCYHMYASRGGAIFGQPLEETMKYEHKRGRSIPFIVEACVKHLGTYAMETEGIFRLPGRAGLMKELRGKFEMGQPPDLDNVDVHTVGSLLKAYLREMPESLVPPSFYQRAMNCAMRYAEADSDETRNVEVTCLTNLLADLPNVKYATLAYICRFLHGLADKSEKTKMTVHNLSLVIGPNLIRHMDNSPELLMLTADLTKHLAYMIIHHCPEILPVRHALECVPSEAIVDHLELRRKNPFGDNTKDDLLRMSCPVDSRDPGLLIPRPTALDDLIGLDLNSQQSGVSESDQSCISPPTPFVFVSNYFEKTSASQKQDDFTSTDYSGDMKVPESGGQSDIYLEKRPVPPKRTKSRTLRNRRPPGAPPSPVSPGSPRQLHSYDILTALASASKNKGSTNFSLESSGENSDTADLSGSVQRSLEPDSVSKSKNSFDPSASTYSTKKEKWNGEAKDNDCHPQVSDRTPHLNPADAETDKSYLPSSDIKGSHWSQADLEGQVAALKSELVEVKARSEQVVTALKNQLRELRSKYESRILSMEKEHRYEVSSLNARLDAERTACAEAVQKTMNLQGQLYEYKLKYGEIDKAN